MKRMEQAKHYERRIIRDDLATVLLSFFALSISLRRHISLYYAPDLGVPEKEIRIRYVSLVK